MTVSATESQKYLRDNYHIIDNPSFGNWSEMEDNEIDEIDRL